ncbi:MAG: phage tail protein [Phaeodactylibacter sp.]|nr:phage tail protein [Phaeodactylibacter sp.]MCB9049775.1 phage tail protein [Lewinellaceae bacterium]
MYYPPVGFSFAVDFGFGGAEDTYFQSVSGLSVEYDMETIKEGGENRFEHKLPVRTKYSDLVLQRGFLTDSEVLKWCLNAFESREFAPADIQVKLLNENHEPLKTWSVSQAWPKKWSVSDFKAEESTLVIETLELSYRYFKLR